jgi:hypothetical protein
MPLLALPMADKSASLVAMGQLTPVQAL